MTDAAASQCAPALALVVDAYGPGRWFPTYFARHGIRCVHIQSTAQPLPALTPVDLGAFHDHLVHAGSPHDTAERIRALAAQLQARIVCVIPGVEPGVELADQLSELLGVVSNGTAGSPARRNKFLMDAALEAAGVPVPAFFKSADVEQLVAYAGSRAHWPLVLKPLDSAGSNGVFICDSVDDIRRAFAENIGKTNNMGKVNREMLVQSFLDGPEYMVNTVSRDGRHYVSDIWHAKKIRLAGHGFIYDCNVLLDGADPVALALGRYAATVLDALAIRHGPAHAEIIMTGAGPVLVEVGARISGLVDPAYNDLLLEHNQIALAVEAYAAPATFAARPGGTYRRVLHGVQVCLISAISGTVAAVPFKDALGDIASLVGANLKIRPGSRVNTTIDLSSSTGVCNLAGPDAAALARDVATIRARYAHGVELAPALPAQAA